MRVRKQLSSHGALRREPPPNICWCHLHDQCFGGNAGTTTIGSTFRVTPSQRQALRAWPVLAITPPFLPRSYTHGSHSQGDSQQNCFESETMCPCPRVAHLSTDETKNVASAQGWNMPLPSRVMCTRFILLDAPELNAANGDTCLVRQHAWDSSAKWSTNPSHISFLPVSFLPKEHHKSGTSKFVHLCIEIAKPPLGRANPPLAEQTPLGRARPPWPSKPPLADVFLMFFLCFFDVFLMFF